MKVQGVLSNTGRGVLGAVPMQWSRELEGYDRLAQLAGRVWVGGVDGAGKR